eukprot:3681514-Pyramimonas_sp.AAC.1
MCGVRDPVSSVMESAPRPKNKQEEPNVCAGFAGSPTGTAWCSQEEFSDSKIPIYFRRLPIAKAMRPVPPTMKAD